MTCIYFNELKVCVSVCVCVCEYGWKIKIEMGEKGILSSAKRKKGKVSQR